jgi:hypothetical protein
MAQYIAAKSATLAEHDALWEQSKTAEEQAIDDLYYAAALELAIAAGERHRTEQAQELFKEANSGQRLKKPLKRNSEFYRNANSQGFTRRDR